MTRTLCSARIGIRTAALLAAFASSSWAASIADKIAPDTPKTGDAEVIVQFRTAPSFRHHSRVMRLGGSLHGVLGSVNAGVYHVPASAIAALAADDEVVHISPDHAVHGTLEYAEPTVNANIAFQYGFDGTGVGVAVIDSGISNSDDLNASRSSRIVYSQSFVGNGTTDAYGHGEHVAGIIGGNAFHSSGPTAIHTFRGIAPNSNLINLRVLDGDGNGTDSGVIAALQTAIALKSKYNIRIVNLSLGRSISESYTLDPLCQAVEQAWRAGLVVVVAAGNGGRDNDQGQNGYGTILAPGNDPYVITVGAMKDESTVIRSDDQIASYSSKGPTAIDHIVKPDILAPGNRIISLQSLGASLETMAPANIPLVSYYIQNGP